MFGHDEEMCFKLHPELLAKHWAEQGQKCPQYLNNVWTQLRQGTFQQQTFQQQTFLPHPISLPAQQAAYLELNHTQTQHPQNVPPQQHSQGYAMPLQLNEDTVWDYYHTAMTMGQNGIDWNEVLLGACERSCEDMTIEELREYWSKHFIIPQQMLAMIIEGDLKSCVALHRYNLAMATEEAARWSAQDPSKPFAVENENVENEKETKLSAGDYIQVP